MDSIPNVVTFALCTYLITKIVLCIVYLTLLNWLQPKRNLNYFIVEYLFYDEKKIMFTYNCNTHSTIYNYTINHPPALVHAIKHFTGLSRNFIHGRLTQGNLHEETIKLINCLFIPRELQYWNSMCGMCLCKMSAISGNYPKVIIIVRNLHEDLNYNLLNSRPWHFKLTLWLI